MHSTGNSSIYRTYSPSYKSLTQIYKGTIASKAEKITPMAYPTYGPSGSLAADNGTVIDMHPIISILATIITKTEIFYKNLFKQSSI